MNRAKANSQTNSQQTDQQMQQLEAEQLAENINHSAGIARGLFLGFISFAAFLLVTTSTTNDYDLLLQTPIQLPIFNVSVDLAGFYRFAPWAFFFVHANMMMILVLISRKLAIFHGKLSIQPFAVRELLRARLHVFAPVQHLSRQHTGMLRFLLWLTSRVMLVWMPPFLILWLQIDVLAMQDSLTVWTQRFALVADTVMTYFLWSQMLKGRARPLAEIRLPGGRRPVTRRQKWNKFSTAIVMLFILALSFFGATIPLSKWEQQTSSWAWNDGIVCDPTDPQIARDYPLHCNNPISRLFFDGLNTPKRPQHLEENERKNRNLNGEMTESNTQIKENEIKLISRGCKFTFELKRFMPLCWFAGTRWLDDLPEFVPNRIITTNKLDPGSQNNLHAQQAIFNSDDNKILMDQIIGVDLSDRSFVKANFSNMALPKISLDQSKLQGASLVSVQLQHASLSGTQLQGANLKNVQLQRATLSNAQLQGANLEQARLQGALLSNAQLHSANLDNAQLHSANLNRANLQSAILRRAQFEGANLRESQLQLANLQLAKLNMANLDKAQLQGVDLSQAQLQGASLEGTQLQGAFLLSTNFSNSKLLKTNFSKEWPERDLFAKKFKGSDSKLQVSLRKQQINIISLLATLELHFDNKFGGNCIAVAVEGEPNITELVYQYCGSAEELKLTPTEKVDPEKDKLIDEKLILVPLAKKQSRASKLCTFSYKYPNLQAIINSAYRIQTLENLILSPDECKMNEVVANWSKSIDASDPMFGLELNFLRPFLVYAKEGRLSHTDCKGLEDNACLKIMKEFFDEKADKYFKEQRSSNKK